MLRLLPTTLAHQLNAIRPYGFLLIYALMLSGGLDHPRRPAIPTGSVLATNTVSSSTRARVVCRA